MQNFKEVSLGFAEFVSQLIQETFDAILSSQNYQLEKYAELESKLNLPDALYRESFISNEHIEDKMLSYFGFKVEKQMIVDQEFNDFISENFDAGLKVVHNKKLTNIGLELITDFIADLLVTQQKSILSTLINSSNMSNLAVDSGEITAKLELSNLYSEEVTEDTKTTPTNDPKIRLRRPVKKSLLKKELLLQTSKRKIKVFDHKDAITGKSTILIDKKALTDLSNSNVQIPNVRLSVQPTKLSGSSNLYSEIKINFKTV